MTYIFSLSHRYQSTDLLDTLCTYNHARSLLVALFVPLTILVKREMSERQRIAWQRTSM
jgi:hypothetical protein